MHYVVINSMSQMLSIDTDLNNPEYSFNSHVQCYSQ